MKSPWATPVPQEKETSALFRPQALSNKSCIHTSRSHSKTLKERQSEGFNHTAWVISTYAQCSHTFYCSPLKVLRWRSGSEQGIYESQLGPVGRWLSFLAKSGPPLTCLPATTCLSVTPPPWRAARLQSRWEACEGLWMSTHLWLLFPPPHPPDPHPAAESQLNCSWWELTACLTAWLPGCLWICWIYWPSQSKVEVRGHHATRDFILSAFI